jgi:FecR protein
MGATFINRVIGVVAAAGLMLSLPSGGIAEEGDPPERVAVADLIEGAAAVQLAGAGEWTSDLANRPLTSGDKLWVDANSRAELHLGSTAIRLGANTGMQFLDVGDHVAQLRLSAGSMNVRVRYLSPDEAMEIDTPNCAVSLLQAGEYRIDVNESGDAVVVAVWRGQAEVAGQTQSFNLQQQQLGEFHGADTLGVQFSDLPPADTLDQWAQSLDQREDQSLTANFLSRDMTGSSDLDGYGNWQTDPDYGSVWYPPVVAGWVPYSQGCWIWVAPWGWTWIDDAPWGFVPFHYGRWVHVRSGWAWSPGQFTVRPVYAPALVVWGTGASAGVIWFALGYNEIYRPSRRVSNSYLRRVNVSNTYISNIASMEERTVGGAPHYANQAIPGAVLAATPETFASARAVNREPKSLAANQIAITPGNTLPPTPKSLVRAGGNGRRAAVMPPPATFSTPIVARVVPRAEERAAGVERRRLIVTTVPRAPVTLRPRAAPTGAMPATNESSPEQPARNIQLAPESQPIGEARPAFKNPSASRSDRPAVMPRPAPVRPAPAPEHPMPAVERPPVVERPPALQRAPVLERAAPVSNAGERVRTDRPPEPPAKKEIPTPTGPRKPTDRNPQ